MTDAQIEAAAEKAGAIWNGSNWMFEDADLHPFVRTVLAAERERRAAVCDALWVAVTQNERDMLMTGEELRACLKALDV